MKTRILPLLRIFNVFGIAGSILITASLLSAQSLTITSPSGDTNWLAGTTQTIKWTIRAPNPSIGRVPVRLLYQISPEGEWTEIGHTEAFRQTYDWFIPPSISGRVTIRVIWTLSVPITVNSPIFRISGLRASLSKATTVMGSVDHASPAGSDYRIDSVAFQDGRSLDEGIMYSPETANDMRLNVRILWNKVPGRYGIQCNNHKLAIVDGRGVMVLNPATVPTPDNNGVIMMPVSFRIPMGLKPGAGYSFRVVFQPSDPDCDSISSNSERTFSTPLVRMGGNDLVVRVVEAGRHRPDGLLTDNQLRIVYEIMNVSGTELLQLVKVRIQVEGIDVVFAEERIENLRPGVWSRHTVLITKNRLLIELSGEKIAIVIVDPNNEIEELREDNNRDGKRFRWN
jgi:hypothetical protein